MSFPITSLRDDFTNNTQDAIWASSFVAGSATKAETGGQAVLTLPSSVAGTHTAYYRTTAAYDISGDGFVWNIGTMVATGVAATATLDLFVDGLNALRWQQLSNVITARTIIAGVDTQLFTATWSSSTYKYLRIRESGGTIFWDSSTNGTSWTNRASVANPFASALYVQFGVSCGNIASPGSLRLDDVNLILPTPTSTWRYTTADWSITNRLRPVTLAATNNAQAAIVTADSMDSAEVLSGNLHYFGGPLGSSSGGYLALTEYASLALAEASPFPIPVDGRVDLPYMIDARYMRLYHRSTDSGSHTIREFVPRRIVQADDIEAESIKAINISAGAITADKISVLNLQAVSAQMGSLHMDGVIDISAAGGIYQGSGTFASPTTGLKLFNSGGVGKLSGYNASVEQITLDTDGKLKAGAGAVILDANGMSINNAIGGFGNVESLKLQASGVNYGYLYAYDDGSNATVTLSTGAIASRFNNVGVSAAPSASGGHSRSGIYAQFSSTQAYVHADYNNAVTSILAHATTTTVDGGLNVGTATGATAGQISTSGSVGIGIAVQSNGRVYIKGQDATSSNWALVVQDSGNNNLFYVRDDGYLLIGKSGGTLGFYGAGANSKPTITGSRGANAALASLLTALATLGLLTDSST